MEYLSDIIVAIVSAGGAIIANQTINNRKLSEKDLEHAKVQQAFEDRLRQVEKQQEQHDTILDKLNSMDNTITGIKKDIEYLRKDK